MKFRNISFHESTVLQLQYNSNSVLIDLDGVTTSEGCVRTILQFSNVSALTSNNSEILAYDSKGQDGEILTLEIDEEKKQCLCIIEWNDFKLHQKTVESLKFYFEMFELNKK